MTESVSINVPQGNNLLIKSEPKKVQVDVPKFRSFAVTTTPGYINVKTKNIEIIHLYNLLKDHGFSKTSPIYVTMGPTKFVTFDWHAFGYVGNTSFDFDWNGTRCSLTANGNNVGMCVLYFRVHDMTPGVGEQVMNEIADELYKHWKDPVPSNSFIVYTTVCAHGIYQWQQHSMRLQRDIGTIYLDDTIKSQLVNELDKFYNSSELYDKYGVTWKRVHLFHGKPGTGKTSTVTALASIFKKHIAKMTLTPNVTSQDIERLFQTVPAETFLLLEDVDALFTDRTANSGIDFSTLLNCMDGLTTRRGLVVFMTTNHVQKLDAAFLRPGRVDKCVESQLPKRAELQKALDVLASDFKHEHEAYLNSVPEEGMSIATLQKHLFDCVMSEKTTIL